MRRAPAKLARIFMSPGPIYDPEGREPDFWRTSRALFAAGFRAGDVALNCFSYHFSPAASMFETGLASPRMRGDSRRHGADGNAGACDQRPASPSGYVGTPSVPQDHPRESRRARARVPVDPPRGGLGRGFHAGGSRVPVATGARRATRRTAPRTSASSPTRREAREGLVVNEEHDRGDRASRHRAIRWPRARWARSW